MKAIAMRLLAAVGLAALVFAGGYGVGWQQADSAAAVKAAAELESRKKAIKKAEDLARQEGEAAVARLRKEYDQARQYQAGLKEKRRHVPLSVPLTRAPAKAVCPEATVQGAPAEPDAGLALAVPELTTLTLGAVSLWNSALAGADVPAGACRVDDPTSEACAAGAGLSLLDAWDNQAANAASCAADRQRYTELIGLLCRRPGQTGCVKEQP